MDKELLEPNLKFLFEDIHLTLIGQYEDYFYKKYGKVTGINALNRNNKKKKNYDAIDEVFWVSTETKSRFKFELGLLNLGKKAEKIEKSEQKEEVKKNEYKIDNRYQIPKDQFDNILFIINTIKYVIRENLLQLSDDYQRDRIYFKQAVQVIYLYMYHIRFYHNLIRKDEGISIIEALIGFILSYTGIILPYDEHRKVHESTVDLYIAYLRGKMKNILNDLNLKNDKK